VCDFGEYLHELHEIPLLISFLFSCCVTAQKEKDDKKEK
jgi:hypothetical protein